MGTPCGNESVSTVTTPSDVAPRPIRNFVTRGPEAPDSDDPPVLFSPHPRALAPRTRTRAIASAFRTHLQRDAEHYHGSLGDRASRPCPKAGKEPPSAPGFCSGQASLRGPDHRRQPRRASSTPGPKAANRSILARRGVRSPDGWIRPVHSHVFRSPVGGCRDYSFGTRTYAIR